MKVLFVANDTSLYGTNKSTLNLIDELIKKKIEIRVIIPCKGEVEKELNKRNIKYKIFKYYSGIIKENLSVKKILKANIKMFLNIFNAIKISKWVKEEKIDIIHSANSAVFIGYFISKYTKIKHVWHIRELMKEDHGFNFFNENIAFKMFDSADYRIFVSKTVENKYKNILKNKKSKMIYNGIPIYNYRNIEIPKIYDNYKLLISGSICESKGQIDAIKAVEYLIKSGITNIELYIAGEGNSIDDFKDYVITHKLEKNIQFLGFRNDLDDIRKRININLICSKKEAFGRVTVEGMLAKNLTIRFKYRRYCRNNKRKIKWISL